MKCDKCDKPATIHLTDIVDGQKIEKHLCEQCAVSEGITKPDVPISQLLEDFILQTGTKESASELVCDVCGLSFAEFRHGGVLGCPHDYDVFAEALTPLLERTQLDVTEHVGKVPRRTGQDRKKRGAVLKLRAQLRGAIAAEDYERAASLRDQIREFDSA